ncbi:MAG: vanadium-dependent haloperoxidase [Acidobacteriota bacterium]
MKHTTLKTLACVALLLVPATLVHARSEVIDWNRTMLDAIAANPPSPTHTTWKMYMVSSAMYDAWAAYDADAVGTRYGSLLRRPAVEHTDANQLAAVGQAAYRTLTYSYPNQEAQFLAILEGQGLTASDSRDPSTPAGIGNLVADAAIESRQDDGANVEGGFEQITSATFPELYVPVNSPDAAAANAPGGPDFDPNRWQPLRVPTGTRTDDQGQPIVVPDDPDSFVDQTFLSPHWGAIRPFALTHGSQFLPSAPPQLGSNATYVDALGNEMTNDVAYRTQLDEVIAFSVALTDEQKILAEFWADGPRTWTPPGHWNQLAQGISIRDQHSLGDDVKMYFALNGALHDAAIAAWDAKRRHDYVRPASAIRDLYFGQTITAWGGPNQGTQQIQGEDWQPYQALDFVTPGFAEYVSGHSTFSRAAREVLRSYSGSDALYDGVTKLEEDYDGDGELDLLGEHIVLPGGMLFEDGPDAKITLEWPTLLEAADSAGLSRLYGGIHFQDGDIRGRQMGEQIGLQAFDIAQRLWTGENAVLGSGTCAADSATLCIDGRWQVQARFETQIGDGASGVGQAKSLESIGVDQGGLFYFFNEGNPELVVKVLDGCVENGHYWVLLSAATNVGYTVQVVDTMDGSTWSTTNPDGVLSPAVIDVMAQPCDP